MKMKLGDHQYQATLNKYVLLKSLQVAMASNITLKTTISL